MTYEVFNNILTEPTWTLGAVLILWLVFYIFLVFLTNPSPLFWIRLEYTWVLTGILGIVIIVAENNKNYKEYELNRTEYWIEKNYNSLQSFLLQEGECFQFNNTGIWTEEEFQDKQLRSDSICEWRKNVKSIIDTLITPIDSQISNIPDLNVSHKNQEYDFTRIISLVEGINKDVSKKNSLKKDLKNNFIPGFRNSFGILFLVVAFSLRLTLISKKVKDEKKRVGQ